MNREPIEVHGAAVAELQSEARAACEVEAAFCSEGRESPELCTLCPAEDALVKPQRRLRRAQVCRRAVSTQPSARGFGRSKISS